MFSGTDVSPAAVLGVRGPENLFVAPDGTWTAKYVPAFLRRYPFVFSQAEERLILCIDDAFPGLNREGRGQPLFQDDGSPSPYVDGVVKFLGDYQALATSGSEFLPLFVTAGNDPANRTDVHMAFGP